MRHGHTEAELYSYTKLYKAIQLYILSYTSLYNIQHLYKRPKKQNTPTHAPRCSVSSVHSARAAETRIFFAFVDFFSRRFSLVVAQLLELRTTPGVITKRFLMPKQLP